MIDIKIGDALRQFGKVFEYRYEDIPKLQEICFAQPLTLHATYCTGEDGISINGNLHTKIYTSCVRCLTVIEYTVVHDFDELFLRRGEKEAEEGYTFSNTILSLDQLVYDAVMLALPQRILCSEDCSGLCPECGADFKFLISIVRNGVEIGIIWHCLVK